MANGTESKLATTSWGLRVLGAVLLLACASCRTAPRVEAPEVWFEDIRSAPPVDADGAEALTRWTATAILRMFEPSREAKAVRMPLLPEAVREDTAPRIVFLSVSDGQGPALVAMGSGQGLLEAVEDVVAKWRRAWPETDCGPPKWIKLDRVSKVDAPGEFDGGLRLPFLRGLHGIAFERRSGVALLPEELACRDLLDKRGRLLVERLREYMKLPYRRAARLPKLGDVGTLTLHRFETISHFADANGVLPLHRGRRDRLDPTAESLLDAARLGGDYLIRSVKPNGRFVYSYRPESDSEPEQYNILRHAGTVYAMLELYEVTKNPKLLAAAERAIGYLLAQIKPSRDAGSEAACVVERDTVKLGGNALAALALCKYIEVTGERSHLPTVRRLGQWMRSVQAESGEFTVHKMRYTGGEVAPFRSAYYPGEAILALVRMHAADPEGGWLDVAERGARWIVEVRDSRVPGSALFHDQWLLYSLGELCRLRPGRGLFRHALRLSDAVVVAQHIAPPHPDWVGGYHRPPRSTPTATRTEGLCAVYSLVRQAGYRDRAVRMLDAVRLGTVFVLQMQFRPESVMYFDDPQRALGGIHAGLTNYEVRIDYVQHCISALLGYRRILLQEQADD